MCVLVDFDLVFIDASLMLCSARNPPRGHVRFWYPIYLQVVPVVSFLPISPNF